MAGKSLAGGELYFIGEIDPHSNAETNFVKVGIVREKEGRFSDQRLKEHQTGNPRQLRIVQIVETSIVERVETTMHGIFATSRLSGEWFSFMGDSRESAIAQAKLLAADAESYKDDMVRAEEVRRQVSSPEVFSPTEELSELHKSIVELRAQTGISNGLIKALGVAMRDASKNGLKFGNLLDIQIKKPSDKFDEIAFKEKYPDLWAKYAKSEPKLFGLFRVIDPVARRPDPFTLNPELSVFNSDVQEMMTLLATNECDAEEVHDLYLRVLQLHAPLQWKLDLQESKAQAKVGEASGVEGLFTWKRELKARETFDKKALQGDYPEQFSEFVTTGKPTEAIVPAKDRGFRLPN